MSAPIRKEIVMAPGESLQRSAEWAADLFPAGTTRLDGVTGGAGRDRGAGTLSITGVAASADSLEASWLATLSEDAVAGSVFSVTLVASVGSIRAKVAERVVVVG